MGDTHDERHVRYNAHYTLNSSADDTCLGGLCVEWCGDSGGSGHVTFVYGVGSVFMVARDRTTRAKPDVSCPLPSLPSDGHAEARA